MQFTKTSTIRRVVILGLGAALSLSFMTGTAAATDNGHSFDPSRGNAGQTSSTQDCDGTHHSDTGHGANQSGAYDNTCDGSPSGNGVGDGGANGKPCAGCVGNADDKNPPGQAPDGSDNNAGYECDRNQGIGKTNPAHTGCAAGTDAGDTGGSDDNEDNGGNGDNRGNGDEGTPPAHTCPNGEAMTDSSGANCSSDNPSSSGHPESGNAGDISETPGASAAVLGNALEAGAAASAAVNGDNVSSGRPTEVLGIQIERGAAGSGLARTGLATLPLLGVATMLCLAGVAMTSVRRRPEDSYVAIAERLAGF